MAGGQDGRQCVQASSMVRTDRTETDDASTLGRGGDAHAGVLGRVYRVIATQDIQSVASS